MAIEIGKIRNVGVVGHGGVGKTSLVEALLFTAGAVTRLGRVDDGSTTTDFDPDEVKRKISINTSGAYLDWKGHRVNLVDTAGDGDLIADGRAGLRLVDGALVERAKAWREKLVEAAAETDDDLLTKYLEDGVLDEASMLKALKGGIGAGTIVPVLCAGASRSIGSHPLIDMIAQEFPSPADRGDITGPAVRANPTATRTVDPKQPPVPLVFKTRQDPH